MVTRRLTVGPEDVVNEIDTNADGKPDIRVIQDLAPQQAFEDLPGPPPIPPDGPLSAADFDRVATLMDPSWRSMLEHPRHPLHHLAGA